jgi:hypothetical protein
MCIKNAAFWDVTSCDCLRTHVLEERITYIISVTRIGGLETTVTVTSNRFLSLWWWRRYFRPKHRLLQGSHRVTSQKTAFFIVIALKTPNLNKICIHISSFSSFLGLFLARWSKYSAQRSVAAQNTDKVIISFNLRNPSSRIMVQGFTQPLTKMSTRNILGSKARSALVTASPPSVSRLSIKCGIFDVSLASVACYRESFAYLYIYMYICTGIYYWCGKKTYIYRYYCDAVSKCSLQRTVPRGRITTFEIGSCRWIAGELRNIAVKLERMEPLFIVYCKCVICPPGVCMAESESGLNSNAVGRPNSDRSRDYGIFQVRTHFPMCWVEVNISIQIELLLDAHLQWSCQWGFSNILSISEIFYSLLISRQWCTTKAGHVLRAASRCHLQVLVLLAEEK